MSSTARMGLRVGPAFAALLVGGGCGESHDFLGEPPWGDGWVPVPSRPVALDEIREGVTARDMGVVQSRLDAACSGTPKLILGDLHVDTGDALSLGRGALSVACDDGRSMEELYLGPWVATPVR